MPRGVKKIIDIRTEMAKIDDQIKLLQEQKAALAKKKLEEDAVAIRNFLAENDIALSDAINVLSEAVAAASVSESVNA